MATIIFHHVDFDYPSSGTHVFQGLSLLLDTRWRTGLVGRNGRGKTTLARLLTGQLRPSGGSVSVPVTTRYLCGEAPSSSEPTLAVVKDAVAPFEAWERDMQAAMAQASPAALARYGELESRYAALGGYEIDARIAREFEAMGLDADILARPFDSLSAGERTRALVVAAFLDSSTYPVLDEPTNHLDMQARAALMAYLAGREGFLLISHDRYFLDGAVDHVLSINRSDVRINRANYSQWRAVMDHELAFQAHRRQSLARDVARLEQAARASRAHAASREGDKYRTGAMDKGFIGARAARKMKRARHAERRIEDQLAEKRGLFANAEKKRALRLNTEEARGEWVLRAQNLTLAAGKRVLCRELSLSVAPGERVAIVGPNGCGKSTLLDALAGRCVPQAGVVTRPGWLTLARAQQVPGWRAGTLRQRLAEAGLEETCFRTLLAAFHITAEVFERDLGSFSHGELKKVELARSLLGGAALLLWDEPLNYIDVLTREQIEQAVLEWQPTLVFVEHDRRFVERVATRVIEMV